VKRPTVLRRGLPLLQRPSDVLHEVARLDAERACHLHDLDEVEPTLPSLVLGDEGLGAAEEPRKLSLSHTP
jgi:hypothetical protein